jgi:DNA primase
MIPPAFIDELLARTDIVEIIEPKVALKKSGQNYSGLCPFHQEKSPSFSVSQEKQFYYCFGCQASGSALKFLMEFDRLDFVSAVETLAGRLGLAVPNDRSEGDEEAFKKRNATFEILSTAKDFYKQQLKGHPERQRAVDYLKQRGLTGQIAAKFELGFAPPGWQHLLGDQGDDETAVRGLLAAGLIVDQQTEGKRYDRFRDRVMFPIRDLRGRTIAFGGRVIGDGKPKYLNSPETEVFHKGQELYGLFEARKSVNKLSRLLVVEGYMDVVALAQNGIEFAVATLGTATSDDHIQRMYRIVSEIVFCFDGDAAGLRAAWKALLTVLPHLSDGRSARFMFLPSGDDPDTLVRRVGQSKFLESIDAAQSVSDWFFTKLTEDLAAEGIPTEDIAGKAALSNRAMPLINLMPDGVFRQLMIDALSTATGLASDRLKDVTVRYQPSIEATPPVPPEDEISDEYWGQEEEIEQSPEIDPALAMLILQPELALEFSESEFLQLAAGAQNKLIQAIATAVHTESLTSPGEILARYARRPEQSLIKKAFEYKPLLPQEHLRDEFIGRMQRKFVRFQEVEARSQINHLLLKPPSALTDEERQLLRQHLSKRS